jgi:hypothetical protein
LCLRQGAGKEEKTEGEQEREAGRLLHTG